MDYYSKKKLSVDDMFRFIQNQFQVNESEISSTELSTGDEKIVFTVIDIEGDFQSGFNFGFDRSHYGDKYDDLDEFYKISKATSDFFKTDIITGDDSEYMYSCRMFSSGKDMGTVYLDPDKGDEEVFCLLE